MGGPNSSDRIQAHYRAMERLINAFLITLPALLVAALCAIVVLLMS